MAIFPIQAEMCTFRRSLPLEPGVEVEVAQRFTGDEGVVVWDAALVLAFFLQRHKVIVVLRLGWKLLNCRLRNETEGWRIEKIPKAVFSLFQGSLQTCWGHTGDRARRRDRSRRDLGGSTRVGDDASLRRSIISRRFLTFRASCVVTDLEHLLPLIEESIQLNQALFGASKGQAVARALPWGDREVLRVRQNERVFRGGKKSWLEPYHRTIKRNASSILSFWQTASIMKSQSNPWWIRF